MKIYSWNVLCYNKKVAEVASYIKDLDFDVICLQEVTPQLLQELKTLPYHLTYHVHALQLYKANNTERNYVAIVSKHQFVGHHTFEFADFPFPKYTRALIKMFAKFDWEFVSERGGIYADVRIDGKVVRVFSVHLTLWGPKNRANEFALVAQYVDPAMPTVIAGDFNVIESPPLKILNALLGASFKESLPTYPERRKFEELFEKYDFDNPLRGHVTHDFSKSQLDHILVSKDIDVKTTIIQAELHGSDHHPVGIEAEFRAVA